MTGKRSPRIKCDDCDRSFEPDAAQRRFIATMRERGMRFMMLECPSCGLSASYDPVAGGAPEAEEPGPCCPVSGCAGTVSDLADLEKRPAWGCGECGSIWYEEKNLQAEITAIVAKYPYRRRCYVKRRGTWVPADPSKLPEDHAERVEQEPDGTGPESVRG